MAIDFPPATESPFLCPENGLTYSWNNAGGYWEVIAYNPGDDSGAAIDIGVTPPDNPEQGDLWWNSADADGRMYIYYEEAGGSSQWVDASPPGSGGGASGEALWELDGSDIKPKDDSHNVEIGGDSIQLNTNGQVITETAAGVDNYVVRTDTNVNIGYIGWESANGTFRFGTDGNRGISFDTNGTRRCLISSAGGFAIGGTLPASPNITLNADGSAEFTKDVQAGSRDPANNTDARGVRIAVDSINGGVYAQCRGDSADPGSLMAFQALNGTAERFSVNFDGSASFSGKVTTSGDRNAYFVSNRVDDTTLVFAGQHDGTETSSIKANGSADFAGSINAGNRDPNSTTARGVRIAVDSNNGGCYVQAKSAGSPTQLLAFQAKHGTTDVYEVKYDGTAGFRNAILKLEPDNDANYTVTTDSEGNESRVYNGPTLDVKERVMNLISRLDAIEANEVIDDATDTSLLQLVANASNRLDSLEARIAALEGGNN